MEQLTTNNVENSNDCDITDMGNVTVEEAVSEGKYGGLDVKPFSEIPARRINWLWPGMLAQGKFHVFAGDGGIGKTQILINLSAIISRGGYFAGQKESCKQGKVLYLTGEDDINDTIKPRLIACGAKTDNVIALGSLMPDGSLFNLSKHLNLITDMVNDDGNYKLFIIDPVTAFCGDQFDNNSVISVRSLAAKLRAFAEDTGLAVIGLTHLTKDEQRSAVNRIIGSGAWVHASRLVLGAVLDDGNYYFGKWKANIANCQPVYPYNMTESYIDDHGSVHFIEFDKPLLGRSLDEFQCVSTGRGETGATVLGILEEELADGEWKPKDDLVATVLNEVSCAVRTIQRTAFKELNVETYLTQTFPQKAMWRLPVSQGAQS